MFFVLFYCIFFVSAEYPVDHRHHVGHTKALGNHNAYSVVTTNPDYSILDEETIEVHYDDSAKIESKNADIKLPGEIAGCAIHRDCLSCAAEEYRGCTWFPVVGCVRAGSPSQCSANPFVPGEVKVQCVAYPDCSSCTIQAGCVFYKGTCTYSSGLNCANDPLCINYQSQCPAPRVVPTGPFGEWTRAEINPVAPHLRYQPFVHRDTVRPINRPLVYQDISIMTDPYRSPHEHMTRIAEGTLPLPGGRYVSPFHRPVVNYPNQFSNFNQRGYSPRNTYLPRTPYVPPPSYRPSFQSVHPGVRPHGYTSNPFQSPRTYGGIGHPFLPFPRP